jgi:multiple sugar transport system ATP-binding protein
MTLAHRIAVLHAGRLQQYDTPSAVYHRPANLFVAGFLGSPAMNCFEGSIDPGAFVSSGLRIALTSQQLVMLRDHPGITLGVRPEDVEIGDCGEAGQTGRVYVSEEMGNETFVRLSSGGALMTARIVADRKLNFDEQVRFRFKQDKLHFFDTSTTEAIR